jgi:uncharacterized protein YlxW (UPF0749 family)
LDPDYAIQARLRKPAPPTRRRWALALVAVVAGAMFAIAAVQNTQRAPLVASERQELIARIKTAQGELDAQRTQAAALDAELATLRSAAAGGDSEAEARLAEITELGASVGTVAVTGPGVVVTVDDAPGSDTDTSDQVLDLDLQILVNGLWESGAEAVAVNGHRISTLTAIRGAGQAITVDYTSLTAPYRVEAIGDPKTMPASFAQTSAGAWWNDLSRNRGMTFSMTGADELTLAADPGMVLRYASELR